jgi:hypothetical protein
LGLLLGLTPFAAFFVMMRLVSPLAGLIAGFLVSALLGLRMWRRGETVKILEVGSLLLFAVLAFYTVVADADWTVARVRLAVDGGLLAIVLVSLAIDRPFTLQYARERVPAAIQALPRFVRVNRIITAVWAAALGVLVAADAAAGYVPAVPLWVDIAASVGALAGAIWFSVWYPAAVRRAAGVGQ